VTTGLVWVTERTGAPGSSGAPKVAATVLTRTGPGKKTTPPSGTSPVHASGGRPSAAPSQRLTAALVAALKWSSTVRVRSGSKASATRLASSWRTS
jgi:hypothetical protein